MSNPTPRLKRWLIGASAAALLIALGGIALREKHAHDLQQAVATQHVTVKIIQPKFGPSEQALILPGNVRANFDAPIYARVSGYLKVWHTDIGTPVKKGQVLAEIETPELDQQILRAQAELASATSSQQLAEVTARRWQNLLATDSVSHQESDEKQADAKAKTDALNAARANLKSLRAQQAFNRIVAPFDGVVTERNTDIGKLVSPGSSSNGRGLFRVVDLRTLRVYVEVPQRYSYLVHPGMQVVMVFPERPAQHFTATVTHVADAIHIASRTSTVELSLDNPNGALFPGSYAEAHFSLPSNASVYQIPASVLLFRKEGLQVAALDGDNHVVLKPITIARDLGHVVEVAEGLALTDRIIDSPPDDIAQGQAVRISEAQTAGQP
jgi:RND family efflux transporter MFP subunit